MDPTVCSSVHCKIRNARQGKQLGRQAANSNTRANRTKIMLNPNTLSVVLQ